jgi:hypothetical protein
VRRGKRRVVGLILIGVVVVGMTFSWWNRT